MLFPIGDDDRKLTRPTYVTIGLVIVNVMVFVFLQGFGTNEAFTSGWSVIPYEILTGEDLVSPRATVIDGQRVSIPQSPGPTPIYLTLLSSMFMHGGLMHILGNMLFLWIFGDNVEHRFGGRVFLGLYLASGIAGSCAQLMLDPDSVIPLLGASGAISGVMGAYLLLFPRNRVYTLILYFVVALPAVVVIGLWIGFQIFMGYGSVLDMSGGGGVAYAAHVGGFFAGLILAFILRMFIKEERPSVFTPYYQHYPSRWS